MPKVARVLRNRLGRGMSVQVDSCVRHALGRRGGLLAVYRAHRPEARHPGLRHDRKGVRRTDRTPPGQPEQSPPGVTEVRTSPPALVASTWKQARNRPPPKDSRTVVIVSTSTLTDGRWFVTCATRTS